MTNEKGNFRSCLFGGFNRRDVADYIEKLSAERNRYKLENSSLKETAEKLQDDVDSLTARVAELEEKLDAARSEPLISQISACEEVVAAATSLKADLSDRTAKIIELSSTVDDDLAQIKSCLASLPEATDEACLKISDIIERLNELKHKI